MKFKSQIVTAASGSIGGTTYAHNRGGLYMRGRATPTNPNSAAQQAARNALGSLATRWNNTLTQTQRDAWENYAANTPVLNVFGDPSILTGQQMYVRNNSPRLRVGENVVDNGPTTFGAADLDVITIATSLGQIDVEYNDAQEWAVNNNGVLIIQTSRIVSPSINFLKGPFRFLVKVAGDVAPPPPASPESFTTNAFGQALSSYTGQKQFIRVRCSNADGRLSQAQIVTTIIT